MQTRELSILLSTLFFYGSIIVVAVFGLRLVYLFIKKNARKKQIITSAVAICLALIILFAPTIFQHKRANIDLEDATEFAEILLSDIRSLKMEESNTELAECYSTFVDDTEFNITVTQDFDLEYYKMYYEKTSRKNLSFSEKLFSKVYEIDDTLIYVCPSENMGSFDDCLSYTLYLNDVYIFKDGYYISVRFNKTFVNFDLIKAFSETVKSPKTGNDSLS